MYLTSLLFIASDMFSIYSSDINFPIKESYLSKKAVKENIK